MEPSVALLCILSCREPPEFSPGGLRTGEGSCLTSSCGCTYLDLPSPPCHLLTLIQVTLGWACAVQRDCACGPSARRGPLLPAVHAFSKIPAEPWPLSPSAPRSCRPSGSPTTPAASAASSATSAWTGCPSPWTPRTRSTVSEITTSEEGWGGEGPRVRATLISRSEGRTPAGAPPQACTLVHSREVG